MSIIYSIIFVLFLALTISAISAPAIIYSATLQNVQSSSAKCRIVWLTPNNTLTSTSVTIKAKKSYSTGEKKVNMGSYTAYEMIQEIHCGKHGLKAPFAGVSSPTFNWKFVIHWYAIISAGPS